MLRTSKSTVKVSRIKSKRKRAGITKKKYELSNFLALNQNMKSNEQELKKEIDGFKSQIVQIEKGLKEAKRSYTKSKDDYQS